jgi:hypothetical protein
MWKDPISLAPVIAGAFFESITNAFFEEFRKIIQNQE